MLPPKIYAQNELIENSLSILLKLVPCPFKLLVELSKRIAWGKTKFLAFNLSINETKLIAWLRNFIEHLECNSTSLYKQNNLTRSHTDHKIKDVPLCTVTLYGDPWVHVIAKARTIIQRPNAPPIKGIVTSSLSLNWLSPSHLHTSLTSPVHRSQLLSPVHLFSLFF